MSLEKGQICLSKVPLRAPFQPDRVSFGTPSLVILVVEISKFSSARASQNPPFSKTPPLGDADRGGEADLPGLPPKTF